MNWRTLTAAAVMAALVAAGLAASAPADAATGDPQARQSGRTLWYEWFRSRPDLRPPKVRVRTRASGVSPGYVFLAGIPTPSQSGPMIVDNFGRLVWFKRLPKGQVAADLRVQRYQGKTVLTWWQGRFIPGGYGCGVGVIADMSYRTVRTVRPTTQGRYCPDLHDFVITPRNTALMMFYRRARMNGRMLLDNIVEEVDIATGRVLTRWSAAHHVSTSDSYIPPFKNRNRPWDFFHINSVDQDAQGNLLISARHTWAVYKISPDGKIVWRLGGKRSDFPVPRNARFAWQHDARFVPGGISLYDNAAAQGRGRSRNYSSGMVLNLDEGRRTVSLGREVRHPRTILSRSQGNFQHLPNGNSFIGWGQNTTATEFAPNGRVVFDLSLAPEGGSYRAYRFPWFGRPAESPRVVAARSSRGGTVVFMSWNGSTELRRWRVLAGNSRKGMRTVATVDSTGFQTAYRVRTPARYFAARALNSRGEVVRSARSVTASGP